MFLKMSINYLNLVDNITGELIKQGNKIVILTDYQITSEEFEEKTKWNDYKIAEPLFFNFYHGIELLLKGFLLSRSIEPSKNEHRIEKLYKDFLKYFTNQKKVVDILENYIGHSINLIEPLKTFFVENKITVSKFYEILRYPESRNAQSKYIYDRLKYNDESALIFYKKLQEDISSLIIETVSFGRKNLY